MVWLKMSPQYSFFTKHPVSCYTTQTESPPGVLQYIQQCDSNSFSHLAAVLAFNNTIAWWESWFIRISYKHDMTRLVQMSSICSSSEKRTKRKEPLKEQSGQNKDRNTLKDKKLAGFLRGACLLNYSHLYLFTIWKTFRPGEASHLGSTGLKQLAPF